MDLPQGLGTPTPLMDMDFSLTSPLDPHSTDPNKRRSSRSIKRKKFDDELVEYSCLSTKDSDPQTKKPPKQKTMLQTYYEQPSSSNASFSFPQITADKRARILPRPNTKKSKTKNKPSQFSTKDLGRWKPTDDLALINAVLQSNDLRLVHIGVKFSCKFTLQEIQHRWYALLYDPIISKLATAAMKNLHPDVVANVESKTLYSKEEQQLLASTPMPTSATFDELLKKNSLIFHKARTPKALMGQWQLMKQYYLLDEQTVPRSLAEKIVVPFSELEENMNDNDLTGSKDEALDDELALMDRRDKKEIRTLEAEVARWQVLVDAVSGITPHEFDMHTLAVLKGRLVRYLMRSRQITIGRSSKDGPVDVDLTLEGPATKVSRQQGTIRLRNNGDFFIMNEGKRPIFVDGRPILANNKYRLNDNSVVEIAGLRFVFLVNTDLISVIRQEAAKMNLGG